MTKLELKKIYLRLDLELIHLNENTDPVYLNDLRDDVKEVISQNIDEIDSWIVLLKERSISCYELEQLIEAKRESVKLERLKIKGMTQDGIEHIKGDVLRLIAKSILNTYLDSLFKKPSINVVEQVKNTSWF